MSSGTRKAFIVVDLGFGDAGKGLLTDYLVRRHDARLVVRFNGGAQAGHNVVTADGRHHTFSQFGSGSFVPGVRTHLSRAVVVHPTALAVEAEVLAQSGIADALERISIDGECRVTTPFQQAHNRLTELARGADRHGSCGVGVGVTVSDSLHFPALTVRFGDLLEPSASLQERLRAQQEQKRAMWRAAKLTPEQAEEFAILQDETVVDRWLELASDVARRAELLDDREALGASTTTIFEGAQGVLLDEDFGFHPYTTYSRCTPHGALRLLAEAGFSGTIRSIGVLRSYAVRHGPGPFPTEAAELTATTTEPHNCRGPWQGPVRKGYFDVPLLRYALAASEHLDALCLTHLDELPAKFCDRYADTLPSLPRSIEEQVRVTQALFAARPHYVATGSAEAFCARVSELVGVPVAYTASGPRASDVSELSPEPHGE
ncbi:MAG: adenylosuccinate synthetase [Myxococcota bacterium]